MFSAIIQLFSAFLSGTWYMSVTVCAEWYLREANGLSQVWAELGEARHWVSHAYLSLHKKNNTMLVASFWLYDVSSCHYVNCHRLGPGATGHWPLSPRHDGCDNVTFINFDHSFRSRHRSYYYQASGEWCVKTRTWSGAGHHWLLTSDNWQCDDPWPRGSQQPEFWALSRGVRAWTFLIINNEQCCNVMIVLRHFDIFDLMKSTDE